MSEKCARNCDNGNIFRKMNLIAGSLRIRISRSVYC
jgi:hypothetical protein